MKNLNPNPDGSKRVRWLLIFSILIVIVVVVWYVLAHHHKAAPGVSKNAPSQQNSTVTKLAYYPDNNISYKVSNSWIVSYNAQAQQQEINSSNQTTETLACPVGSGSGKCTATQINVPDATLVISKQALSGATSLQQWIQKKYAGVLQLDPNLFVTTTLAGQPATCNNPNDKATGGGASGTASKAPAQLPSSIPAGLFTGQCYVLWKGSIYSLGVVDLYNITTDNQQVFNLISSLKFV